MGLKFGCQVSWRTEARTASYEITVVHLSVRPSLNFFKIESLVFSDIVLDDWPWYLVTDEATFLKKKIVGPNLGQMGPETRFFAIFSSLVN